MVTGSNTYDEVPYDNLAFAQTHPDRLATTARMFGLEPPPIATARVLELGCASGGNLIPMAFNLPGGEFVGIDLSRRHVDAAQSTIRALGMRNMRIDARIDPRNRREWGRFDYIICHGVFSWVEPQVQDAILRIAADNLVENGVAYISYNTYPGWHMRERVRHMMRYHAGRFDEPRSRSSRRGRCWTFLASAADEAGAVRAAAEPGRSSGSSQTSDSYLYHEHLEQTNTPLYFHQFVERAERAGLQYLSEADVSDMLASLFPGARWQRRSSGSARTCCISSSTWTSCATGSSGRRCSATATFVQHARSRPRRCKGSWYLLLQCPRQRPLISRTEPLSCFRKTTKERR